jgi:hypothetical protein
VTYQSSRLESGIIYSALLIAIAAIKINEYRKSGGTYTGNSLIQGILLHSWPSLAVRDQISSHNINLTCSQGITASVVIVRVSLGIAFNDLKTEMMTLSCHPVETRRLDMKNGNMHSTLSDNNT